MNDLINFMDNYGFYVFLIFFVVTFIFFSCFFAFFSKKQYKAIKTYYEKSDYEKCAQKIKSIMPLAIKKINKQTLEIYLVGIHLVFNEYEDASKILNGINHPKLLSLKYFWECYIYLRKNDLTNAISSFENAKKCYHKQDIDFQIMNDIIVKLSNVKPITENKELTQKIIHPRVREFYVSVMNDGKKS